VSSLTEAQLLMERDPALPIVHVGISTLSGGAYDPPGLEGLTRLSGRLMRRTAGGRTADEVDNLVDRIGASVGIDSGTGSTTISGSVLKRSADTYLELLKETLTAPGLFADELERLKRETLAELTEVLDNDRSLARRWFLRGVFESHLYGRTLVGNKASLERVGVDDIKRHLSELLVRGNLIFSFAGDIDPDQATRGAQVIAKALAAKPALPDPVVEPRPRQGRHLIFVDKPDRTQTQIMLGNVGSHPNDADYTALHVANTVFGGTFTSRLSREVRGKRGWSYGAYASLAYERHRQTFSLYTFPKADDAGPCIALELELLEAWHEDGISADELDWVQQYLTRSHAFDRDTTSKRIGLKLDELLNDLPRGYYGNYVSSIHAVTRAQANEAVQRRISPKDLVIVVVGTHADIGGAVRDSIPDLASETVVPFDTP
jgi:zinc protease